MAGRTEEHRSGGSDDMRFPRVRRRPALAGTTALFLILACGGDGGTGPGNGGGNGGDGGGGGGGNQLAAPTSFSADPVSSARIALSWSDPATDETGFELQRSPDGSADWTDVVTTDADVTSYEDAGLDPGTRYVYRVRTVRGGDTSDWSSEADAETLEGTLGAAKEIERIVAETLPPPSTSIDDRNLADEVNAVAAAIRGTPGVDTVFPLEGVLATQAVLEDGTVLLFINNRPPGLEDRGDGSGGSAAFDEALTSGPAATGGPPGSARAVSVAFDGGASVAAEVEGLLSESGYDVTGLTASLPDMRSYSNLGALYLDTHGVSYTRFEPGDDGNPQAAGTAFAIQTATAIPGANLSPWANELSAGDLVVAITQDASGNTVTKFGVTDSFIEKHWSFDDGVVMIHACFAGSGPFTYNGVDLNPRPIQNAILAAGADVLVSFDHLTNASLARPSILYFFDRMLGADSYDPEDPPLRPFDLPEVRAGMSDEDLLEFNFPWRTLAGIELGSSHMVGVTFHTNGGRAALAPSIRSMDMVDDAAESEGRLTLQGRFGDEQGEVKVDGAGVDVRSWSDESIEVGVPFKGYAGPVTVESPAGIESNEAPLTEWTGTVTLTLKGKGSTQIEADMEVRFRADVHAFRDRLDQEPRHRTFTSYISPASEGTSTGSGSFTEDGTTVTYHGSHDMRLLTKAEVSTFSGTTTETVFGGKVILDPDAGSADVCLAAWIKTDVTVQAMGRTETTTTVLPGIFVSLVDRFEGATGCVEVDMDDDTFFIEGYEDSITEEDFELTLKWDRFVPAFAPDEDTAG